MSHFQSTPLSPHAHPCSCLLRTLATNTRNVPGTPGCSWTTASRQEALQSATPCGYSMNLTCSTRIGSTRFVIVKQCWLKCEISLCDVAVLVETRAPTSLRAAPLVRGKAKFPVKNAVCPSLPFAADGVLTVNLAFTLSRVELLFVLLVET